VNEVFNDSEYLKHGVNIKPGGWLTTVLYPTNSTILHLQQQQHLVQLLNHYQCCWLLLLQVIPLLMSVPTSASSVHEFCLSCLAAMSRTLALSHAQQRFSSFDRIFWGPTARVNRTVSFTSTSSCQQ
jgi:hypothetical protein